MLRVSSDFEIRRPKSVTANASAFVPPSSIVDYERREGEMAIVPKRGPRPPSRKRPKSTPILSNISYLDKKR